MDKESLDKLNRSGDKEKIKETLDKVQEWVNNNIQALIEDGIQPQQATWLIETAIEAGGPPSIQFIEELKQKIDIKLQKQLNEAKSKEDIKQIFNSFRASPQNT